MTKQRYEFFLEDPNTGLLTSQIIDLHEEEVDLYATQGGVFDDQGLIVLNITMSPMTDNTPGPLTLFPECATGHPDDHWYLNPICQECDRPLGDYPHNNVGKNDWINGVISEPQWHVFVDPSDGPLVFGVNAYRKNDCPRGRDWGTENERECSCACHRGSPYVNVYRLDQGYGGPEEGGWYYEIGEPVAAVPCETLREAEATRAKLEERYPQGRNRYSVMPRGEDFGVWIEYHFPEAYPIERPRYE